MANIKQLQEQVVHIIILKYILWCVEDLRKARVIQELMTGSIQPLPLAVNQSDVMIAAHVAQKIKCGVGIFLLLIAIAILTISIANPATDN